MKALCMLHSDFTDLIERELLTIEVSHCGNRNFQPFWLLWPDDLHIRTKPVSPADTGYVKMIVLCQGFRKLLYEGQWMCAFSYAWSLPVTWQRWRSHHSICHNWKPHATCKADGSICYRTEVMGNQSLWCRNRHFGHFRLLWPWPWPNDIHIRTWPVLPGDILDVQIWTSYVKAFDSYHLKDI